MYIYIYIGGQDAYRLLHCAQATGRGKFCFTWLPLGFTPGSPVHPSFIYQCVWVFTLSLSIRAPDPSAPQAASDFDPTSHADFGAATHPGVGGGTHRRRATVERC